MYKKTLKRILESHSQEYDIFVLKGFAPEVFAYLSQSFKILDEYIFVNGKIVLSKVDERKFLQRLIDPNFNCKGVCSIESLIKLCNNLSGLSIIQKKICIIENNLLQNYPNPSTEEIPDYDFSQLSDSEDNPIYSIFYSYCTQIKEKQFIEYIDNYSDENSDIYNIKLIPDSGMESLQKSDSKDYPLLSQDDASIYPLLKLIYESKPLPSDRYNLILEDGIKPLTHVFINACKEFEYAMEIYEVSQDISISPRTEIFDVLKSVWGYDSFRDINIYKDLFNSRETIGISQGTIIETVIQQAEQAYFGHPDQMNNVLLTAPTGAGKSLLFQTAAIYLANKYQMLTIVVSPLVALMDDQVEGLSGYSNAATLNSNVTPSMKQSIMEGIKNGEINILYLSPELLLSYSINSFIGERRLGLLVIDEAHTVTTWGRDFRVDYWFLGDYIRTAKKILNYNFPIFALTATAVWDPHGKNDMVFDTIKSLNMDPCIKYIGAVKRTNISFDIQESGIGNKYEENRMNLTITRIKEAIDENRKTIVYFPFRSTVNIVANSAELDDVKDKVTQYHAWLSKEEKDDNAAAFRSGEKPIMCATKAFGMGIDVSDITEVYHHAPTGCLSDYVQEIGRLARDPKLQGIAKIDFSPNDFRYVRKLHGLSAIKPYQLILVLEKLLSIYKMNGEHRNMLIYPDDFSYIFPLCDEGSIDQNVKSSLLLLSHDLREKLNFQSIIVRPKSLFSRCFISIDHSQAKTFHKLNRDFVKKIDDTHFILDAEKYWNHKCSHISFPNFKYKLASGSIFKGYNIDIQSKVSLRLKSSINETKSKIEEFFSNAHNYLNEMASMHHRIPFSQIMNRLPEHYSNYQRRGFLETFIALYTSGKGLHQDNTKFCRIYNGESEEKASLQLTSNGYQVLSFNYLAAFKTLIKKEIEVKYCNDKDDLILLCEFLNSLGLAEYKREGGEKPSIFIRINNPLYLKNLVRKGKYKNLILERIYEKYKYSERVFTYFFTTPMTNKERWDFIENYFLGCPEEKLLK